MANITAEEKDEIIKLYSPSVTVPSTYESDIVKLAKGALEQFESGGAVMTSHSSDDILKMMLVWACNSFEGGLIYKESSRLNHSCDPNCTYNISPETNEIVVYAITSLGPGEEATISYLGIFLYADAQMRRQTLRRDKFFWCECQRCTCEGERTTVDIASAIPCKVCHPRKQFLSEDVQWEEVTVNYAYLTDGCYKCSHCQGSSASDSIIDQITGKISERLESASSDSPTDDQVRMVIETEMDEQLYQMSISTLGARHWTTNLMLFCLIQRTMSKFNTQMLLGQTMPSMEEIAEACDSLSQTWDFVENFKLEILPAVLMWKETMAISRCLVALGDLKSKKYGSEWIERVNEYVTVFEGEEMGMVCENLRVAWENCESEDDIEEIEVDSNKRRKY